MRLKPAPGGRYWGLAKRARLDKSAPAQDRPIHPSSQHENSDMRMMLAFAAILYSSAALAQTSAPPAAPADKPAAEAKPAKAAKKPAAKGSIAVRLQACQDIEDGTKGRLDCYDEVIKPAPKPK